MSEIKVVTNILQTNDEITAKNKNLLDDKRYLCNKSNEFTWFR